jgi:hypothetical protein
MPPAYVYTHYFHDRGKIPLTDVAYQVRHALDEGMALCRSDIRVLREEIRSTSKDVRSNLSSYGFENSEMMTKVNHLFHAVQSLASMLHLTIPFT